MTTGSLKFHMVRKIILIVQSENHDMCKQKIKHQPHKLQFRFLNNVVHQVLKFIIDTGYADSKHNFPPTNCC